jgi:hypothetical protein
VNDSANDPLDAACAAYVDAVRARVAAEVAEARSRCAAIAAVVVDDGSESEAIEVSRAHLEAVLKARDAEHAASRYYERCRRETAAYRRKTTP